MTKTQDNVHLVYVGNYLNQSEVMTNHYIILQKISVIYKSVSDHFAVNKYQVGLNIQPTKSEVINLKQEFVKNSISYTTLNRESIEWAKFLHIISVMQVFHQL